MSVRVRCHDSAGDVKFERPHYATSLQISFKNFLQNSLKCYSYKKITKQCIDRNHSITKFRQTFQFSSGMTLLTHTAIPDDDCMFDKTL